MIDKRCAAAGLSCVLPYHRLLSSIVVYCCWCTRSSGAALVHRRISTQTVRVWSTWRTWRCFPVLQLRCALILRELNQTFIAYLFKGGQEQFFSLQTPSFTAFLVTVLKILTYALVSTWSSVSSGYEHIPQLMQPWESNLTKKCFKYSLSWYLHWPMFLRQRKACLRYLM